ncbi:hypothetical protein ACXYL9_08610 [Qipengyuania sp. CAU 1752]
MRSMGILASLTLLCTASLAAQSAPSIAIERSVYIERIERIGGRVVRELQPAAELRRGDSVVLMLEWNAPGAGNGFVVSSRIPNDLAYQKSGAHIPLVSVDGARTWGLLADLRIGARRASPEDVTHLRWQVDEDRAARGRGLLSYSAIVR